MMLFRKICRLTCASGSVFTRCESTDALSSSSVLHLSLRLPLSPSSAFSPSTCFPPFHSHALSPVTRALPPPLLAALHVPAEQAQAPLHHWLFSLSPASAPFADQPATLPVSCPQRSSQQQKLLPTPWIIHVSVSVFSFDWQCWVQASDSLQGGSSIIGLQQRIGPAGQTSSHSYQITLIVSPAVF